MNWVRKHVNLQGGWRPSWSELLGSSLGTIEDSPEAEFISHSPKIMCWHLLLLTCHLEPDTAKVLHWTDIGLHSVSKRTYNGTSNALILSTNFASQYFLTCISHSSLFLHFLKSPFPLFLLSSSPSYLNTYIILPLLSSVSRGICARPGAKVYFSFQAAQ